MFCSVGHSLYVIWSDLMYQFFLHIIGWRLSVSINDMLCYVMLWLTMHRTGWRHIWPHGRTQYVRYRGEVSTTTHGYCGVLQGSVLGPVLFLLYVADVIELVKECGLIPHAFADDLQIYGHSVSADTQELVARIERVRCWMASNRLCLNPAKTELIWLSWRLLKPKRAIKLYNFVLKLSF